MRESRRWLGCHGGPERSTKSEVEAPATRWYYGSNSSAYVTFQQTHEICDTSEIYDTQRTVLLSIHQYMDMHQHFHNIVHFDFGLLLENHSESNTKMTSVVTARAKGTGFSREKKSRPLYLNQASYGWSPETHHKIWPKSAQNRPLCTKNHEYLSKFRFS